MRDRLSNATLNSAEMKAAGWWAAKNIPDPGVNEGRTPLHTILHRCNVNCDPKTGRHDFNNPPAQSDIEAAAATVQWFATAAGQDDLRGLAKVLGFALVKIEDGKSDGEPKIATE
ncbi:MAG TPA: hypothetical protein VGP13_00475 [Candidatus Paceibacterota bacterium]|nr:hypothetical protein [Candidatus Paceibacterota bacterium]